jgi:hypothetical protein
MLDDYDSFFYKELFRVIIDELSVDVDIRLIGSYFLYFFFHFHLLGLRNFSYFLE